MNSKQLPSVTVLMSTYNGANYLREQLDSLAHQEGVLLSLLVRDDGSTDESLAILEEYRGQFTNLTIHQGVNLGATASFHEVVKLALDEEKLSDYFAFCDQDDIWLPNKLQRAIQELEKMEPYQPQLYFSNLMMVNNQKEKLGYLLDNRIVSRSRINALAAISTYGCTCVFNRKALEKIARISRDNQHLYHDNWTFVVCAFLGQVCYDEESYLLYRQTGENVSGTKRTGLHLWLHRFGKLFRLNADERVYEGLANELLACFSDELAQEDRDFLEKVTTYRHHFKQKLALIFSPRTKTKRLSKNMLVIARLLLNYY